MPAVALSDIEMSYQTYGEGTPLLALHAATVSGGHLRWFVKAAEAAGFSVIAPDQRGHGDTPNRAHDIHITRLIADNAAFINALGLAPVHGFGYSMGAAVSLHTARLHPHLYRSLVLLAVSPVGPSEAQILRSVGPIEERSPLVRQLFDPVVGLRGGGWQTEMEAFGVVNCPTLIIAADRDTFVDVEEAVALYRVLPRAELLVVPQTGHFDLVNNPLVLEGLAGFFSRLGQEA